MAALVDHPPRGLRRDRSGARYYALALPSSAARCGPAARQLRIATKAGAHDGHIAIDLHDRVGRGPGVRDPARRAPAFVQQPREAEVPGRRIEQRQAAPSERTQQQRRCRTRVPRRWQSRYVAHRRAVPATRHGRVHRRCETPPSKTSALRSAQGETAAGAAPSTAIGATQGTLRRPAACCDRRGRLPRCPGEADVGATGRSASAGRPCASLSFVDRAH
jgi:hypothetical protein